jgi:hypothetical protein
MKTKKPLGETELFRRRRGDYFLWSLTLVDFLRAFSIGFSTLSQFSAKKDDASSSVLLVISWGV